MADQVDGIWRPEQLHGRWYVARYTMEAGRPFRWVDGKYVNGHHLPHTHTLMQPAIDRAAALNAED